MNKIEYELLKDEDGRHYIKLDALTAEDKFFVYYCCSYLLMQMADGISTNKNISEKTKNEIFLSYNVVSNLTTETSKLLTITNDLFNDLMKEINNKNDNKTD